jgi:thioredoxin
MATTIVITDDTFDTEVLKSNKPVLVDFWAEWCGPCKAIEPILEEIAGKYAGKLVVARLDTEANLDQVMNHGVMGLPTLILFKQGKPVERITGAVTKEKLLGMIAPHLIGESISVSI